MAKQSWLTLSEYSSQYKVSVSTLRRRIKAQEVKYQFKDGKYLIFDQPLNSHQVEDNAPPPQSSQPESSSTSVHLKTQVAESEEESPAALATTANTLLSELKKAYSIILQEKEEQIFQLKDEVADLKTLVRVLEEENHRLKTSMQESHSLDEWLKSVE